MHSSLLPHGRARTRLLKARENGYLNAACCPSLAAIHSRWCWGLRLPVVWVERCSAYSRYGRVHLDLFTTLHTLTTLGREALQSLSGNATVSAHDARWERVPLGQLDALARAVLRTVNRSGNYQLDSARTVAVDLGRPPGAIAAPPGPVRQSSAAGALRRAG